MRLQGGDRMLCCWTVAKYPEHRGAAAGHEDSFRPKAQQTFFERGDRRIGWEDRAFQIVDQPLARGPLTGGELPWLRRCWVHGQQLIKAPVGPGGGHAAGRHDKHHRARRERRDRGDDLANAPDARWATRDEKRHIGAQTRAELTEARFGPSQGQQGIQAFQDCRGITTAASQASPSGNAFTEMNSNPRLESCLLTYQG